VRGFFLAAGIDPEDDCPMPTESDCERVRKAGEAIQQTVESYTHGWANTEALREITRLADEALHASRHDGYIAEKVASIKSFASILYSPRKHQKYAQGTESGADRVKSTVYGYAHSLAHWSPMIPE
jgi:hypothetical protein